MTLHFRRYMIVTGLHYTIRRINEQWYQSFELEPDILDDYSESEQRLIRADIWQSLSERRADRFPARKRLTFRSPVIAAAATILIACATALYFFLQAPPSANRFTKAPVETIVPPGEDRATLTLESGVTVDLNAIAVGEQIHEEGVSIVKRDDGSISYLVDEKGLADGLAPFNTVSTPRGGQYRVTLPDGSSVWLNSASSIRYPAVFNVSERVVYLTGEAYFEIKKATGSDGRRLPFIVSTTQQEVEVLGTHFNVKAYEEENATVTTLLEGKVRVVGMAAGDLKQERVLQVGESAFWDRSAFTVRQGEAEKAVAWKNGKFIFTGENIKEIMKNIARWYNVEVSYQGDLRHVNFAGVLSRYENINEILKKLELTGTVKFRIQENTAPDGPARRVVVMP
jgi:transmembrane sensor